MSEPSKSPAPSKGATSSKNRRSLRHVAWVYLCQFSVYVFFKTFFRIKHIGARNIPRSGPTMMVANHQSFFDPPAIGCGYYGVTSCLARKSLFKSKLFAALISSIDTIPLETEGLGYQGIKETMRRLKNGEAILIFPEGQRSFDGELCEFTTGYANIASKAKATLVPIAISGAFEVFPRTKKYPTFFGPRVVVEYGAPIPPEEYAGLSVDEINALVRGRIETMYERNRPRRKA